MFFLHIFFDGARGVHEFHCDQQKELESWHLCQPDEQNVHGDQSKQKGVVGNEDHRVLAKLGFLPQVVRAEILDGLVLDQLVDHADVVELLPFF